MEEGIPPLPSQHGPYPTPTDANVDAVVDPTTAIVPFSEPRYVVIVPKEQIFYVPPPENEHIMKEYQNQLQNRPKTPPYCSRLAHLLLIILAIALLGLSASFIFYLLAKPEAPHFTIDTFVANRPVFDVTLRAQNPSATMDTLHYVDQGGKVDMTHKGTLIANGDPPEFKIGHKHTTEMKLTLHESKSVFPKEVESSLKGANKDVVELKLLAEFPVKLGFGSFGMRSKGLKVECGVRVSKIGKETQIMSQDCEAKLG